MTAGQPDLREQARLWGVRRAPRGSGGPPAATPTRLTSGPSGIQRPHGPLTRDASHLRR